MIQIKLERLLDMLSDRKEDDEFCGEKISSIRARLRAADDPWKPVSEMPEDFRGWVLLRNDRGICNNGYLRNAFDVDIFKTHINNAEYMLVPGMAKERKQ